MCIRPRALGSARWPGTPLERARARTPASVGRPASHAGSRALALAVAASGGVKRSGEVEGSAVRRGKGSRLEYDTPASSYSRLECRAKPASGTLSLRLRACAGGRACIVGHMASRSASGEGEGGRRTQAAPPSYRVEMSVRQFRQCRQSRT